MGWKKTMKTLAFSMAVIMGVTAMPMNVSAAETGAGGTGSDQVAITNEDFLKADGKNLVNQNGEIINLRGTNAGGYLLQEFWMTPTAYTDNVTAEQNVMDILTERFSEAEMYEILDVYQDAYWTEEDFDNCAELGMNVIRLPFWWRNLVDEDGVFYGYDETAEDPYATAFERIDWFVREAGERGMYVVLDCHGVPGSQNASDHSGLDGRDDKIGGSRFWFGEAEEKARYHEIFYDMWEVVAERYVGNPIVAGYDLMNEPYCTYRYDASLDEDELHTMLWDVYDKAYDIIRAKDADHVVIMEATWDPIDLPDPAQYGWENVMYEYHNYLYDDYDNVNGQQIVNMQKKITAIGNADYNVPSYLGEFCYFNNPDAWDEGLELLVDAGINWTTWTYKTTQDYGMWGHYHFPEEFNTRINLETASKEEILTWYARMGEKVENTALTNVVKEWYAADTVANSMVPTYAEIPDGDYYLVGNSTMKVLTPDATSGVIAATDDPELMGDEADQLFSLINNEDGTVSLKAANGKYVSVNTSDNKIYANATEITNTEKFYMLVDSMTTVAFKSVETGVYVSVIKPKLGADEEKPASYDITVESYALTGNAAFQLYDKELGLVGEPKLATYSGWSRYEAEDDKVATVKDGQIEFAVNAETEGEYLISLNCLGADAKKLSVKVNDGDAANADIPAIADGTAESVYEYVMKVNLTEGANSIVISGAVSGNNDVMLDCIDVINAPLGKNDVYTRYEAENYVTNAKVATQAFYSNKQGIEDVNSETAVEDVAFNWSNVKYVDFTIYAEEAGEYTISWGYTGANAEGMKAVYRLNGGENQVLTLDNVGGNWNIPSNHKFNVNLEKGFNKFMLSGTLVNTAHYANIDYIDVKLASVPDSPVGPEGASGWSHFEAEYAKIFGSASKSQQEFLSMGMGVGYLNKDNVRLEDVKEDWSNINYVAFDVEAPRAGEYRVLMKYHGDDDKVGLVKVNDGEAEVISIPRRGDGTWNVMYEYLFTVDLEKGDNTLYISGAVGGGWYDIDYIEVCNSEITVIDEKTQTERYEAEFYKTKSAKADYEVVEVQDSDALRYSGPDHQGVGGMGRGDCNFTVGSDIIGSDLFYTIFTVYAAQAGDYKVKLYANGGKGVTVGAYQVNDEASKNYDYLNENGEWNNVFCPEIKATLKEGLNQIVFSGAYDSWDHWTNFDCIDVTPVREDPVRENPFSDVPEDEWYYGFVLDAYDRGLMVGELKASDEDKVTWNPEASITRAEFVQILYNKEGKPEVEFSDIFDDVKANDWYASAVIWAYENGITSGVSPDSFGATTPVNREQMVRFLQTYAEYKGQVVSSQADLTGYVDDEDVSSWALPGMKWAVEKGIVTGKPSGDDMKLDPKGTAPRAEAATVITKYITACE